MGQPYAGLQARLGHIINVDVSGTFIDFKTTKAAADKKPIAGKAHQPSIARGFMASHGIDLI